MLGQMGGELARTEQCTHLACSMRSGNCLSRCGLGSGGRGWEVAYLISGHLIPEKEIPAVVAVSNGPGYESRQESDDLI